MQNFFNSFGWKTVIPFIVSVSVIGAIFGAGMWCEKLTSAAKVVTAEQAKVMKEWNNMVALIDQNNEETRSSCLKPSIKCTDKDLKGKHREYCLCFDCDNFCLGTSFKKDLKGKHREYCLCFDCDNFCLGTSFKCSIADDLYKLCCKHNLTTPVFECPEFEEK
jgi:hypothetical protein